MDRPGCCRYRLRDCSSSIPMSPWSRKGSASVSSLGIWSAKPKSSSRFGKGLYAPAMGVNSSLASPPFPFFFLLNSFAIDASFCFAAALKLSNVRFACCCGAAPKPVIREGSTGEAGGPFCSVCVGPADDGAGAAGCGVDVDDVDDDGDGDDGEEEG